MTSIPYYNPIYGTPTPEHWEKVLLSQKEVEQLSERDVKCPICGFDRAGRRASGAGEGNAGALLPGSPARLGAWIAQDSHEKDARKVLEMY